MKIIVIAGTDWEQPNPDWIRQPYTDATLRFMRSRVEDWANVFREIGDVARADCLAIGCRGIFDTGAVNALPVARRAWDDSSKAMKITFWGDTVGMGDIVNEPGSGANKFDCSNPQHVEWFWTRFVKLVFDAFPPEAFLTLDDGRVVIALWGIEPQTGHGIINQHDAQGLLDYVDARVRELGFAGAAFIVDQSWPDLCPGLRVYAVHDWFSGHNNPKPWSVRPHIGTDGRVTVGMAVPSFFTTINPSGKSDVLESALALFDALDVDWALLEGATDFSENAPIMRDASGNMDKLHVIARYSSRQQTPDHPDPPTGDHMKISFTNAPIYSHRVVSGWLAGTLEPNPNGTFGVRLEKPLPGYPNPNGSQTGPYPFLSVQPDGSYQGRPSGDGAYESVRVQGSELVIHYEFPAGTTIAHVMPFKELL